MAVILDITEQIKERRFNETISELIQSLYTVSPEELYILLEEYYSNKEIMDEWNLFRQAD